MSHPVRLMALALALALPVALPAETAYAPSQVQPGEDGWETYVDPMIIDAGSAAGLSPAPDTPEAAVVRFLASRVRGDNDWRDAIVDDPARKAKKALKQWDSWSLKAAQLKSRKMKSDDRGYVRVWLDLTISGDSETGTDDFTVVRVGDGWRVSSPPS